MTKSMDVQQNFREDTKYSAQIMLSIRLESQSSDFLLAVHRNINFFYTS
jgi:hypothetical protein